MVENEGNVQERLRRASLEFYLALHPAWAIEAQELLDSEIALSRILALYPCDSLQVSELMAALFTTDEQARSFANTVAREAQRMAFDFSLTLAGENYEQFRRCYVPAATNAALKRWGSEFLLVGVNGLAQVVWAVNYWEQLPEIHELGPAIAELVEGAVEYFRVA